MFACMKTTYTHSLNTALLDFNKSEGQHEFAVNVTGKLALNRLLVSVAVYIFLTHPA